MPELHRTGSQPFATYERIGAPSPEACEHVGHEWCPAGGGLLICIVCEAEKWEDD